MGKSGEILKIYIGNKVCGEFDFTDETQWTEVVDSLPKLLGVSFTIPFSTSYDEECISSWMKLFDNSKQLFLDSNNESWEYCEKTDSLKKTK